MAKEKTVHEPQQIRAADGNAGANKTEPRAKRDPSTYSQYQDRLDGQINRR